MKNGTASTCHPVPGVKGLAVGMNLVQLCATLYPGLKGWLEWKLALKVPATLYPGLKGLLLESRCSQISPDAGNRCDPVLNSRPVIEMDDDIWYMPPKWMLLPHSKIYNVTVVYMMN